MVLLFGNKNYGEHLGYIVTQCRNCKSDRIFNVTQRRQKLTVYFIPTVQYRVKQYMTCRDCGESFEIADELKQEIAKRLMTEKQLKNVIRDIAGNQNGLMLLCQSCSQPITRGMRFCPNCGKPI